MKKFFDTLKNIWKSDELRNRILFTLGLILIYRIGSFIILPGIDQGKMAANASSGGLTDLLDLFAGGAFSKASIMALGIMPYISASIIMQLLGMAVPVVQKMQKEGESGRRKINGYTRFLTIAICAFQGPAYLKMYVGSKDAIIDETFLWWTMAMTILVAGTMFAMWLGERITDKGVGNGVSILITVGILARFPDATMGEFIASDSAFYMNIIKVIVFAAILMVTVLIVQGVRRLPINYAKRVAGGGAVQEQSARSYIPLKVNASGVMPIIFAQAIMSVPMMVVSPETTNSFLHGLADPFSWQYNLVFGTLIIVFTYFYTAITVNPKQIADDLKRNGGFVPGVKPGSDTAARIDDIVSRITLPGSIFLALIAVIPAFAKLAGFQDNFAMFMGGTSMLIMVGVVLDTLQQIETYLMNQHYDGLMEGGKIRGRRGANEMSNVI